ncbi:MAG: peptide-methionine (S)-S-oxide reductase MsrA [Lysobacterales bacterium]
MPSDACNTKHFVHGRAMTGEFPGMRRVLFGMGCFWGAERKFWSLDGVVSTAVGYAGGHSDDPDYRAVCAGDSGHAEVVLVVYDPTRIALSALLRVFWENHDPTQGMRQGNDRGSQYRSAIFVFDGADQTQAEASRDAYQQRLTEAGLGGITTEIGCGRRFHYAEGYHQQYLAKNPGGYCGLGGTGVGCG